MGGGTRSRTRSAFAIKNIVRDEPEQYISVRAKLDSLPCYFERVDSGVERRCLRS